VLGTVDRPVWQRGRKKPWRPDELIKHLYLFREALRFEPMPSWVPEEDLEAP